MKYNHDIENPIVVNLLFSILGEKEDKKKIEENLMDTIENANFEEIERSVTPRKFQECKSNSLAIGMKVSVCRSLHFD